MDQPEITAANVVHIYDAGFPVCYTRSRDGVTPRGPLWKSGPMVRQHALANCLDCLGTRDIEHEEQPRKNG